MRRLFLLLGLGLLGAFFWLAPLWPLLRGAWPLRPLERPFHLLVYASSPEYSGYHRRVPERYRGLADAILLVRLDPGKREAIALSIPRDTWVLLPGHGWHKVNAASPLGGPPLMREAVEGLLGLRVDRYLVVSTEALKAFVDALGGVKVCVEKPMRYEDRAAGLSIDLKPGCQVLRGEEAEGYLRFRQDALGDIGRVQRQQAFLHALRAQVLSPLGLLRLPRAVAAALAHTETDLTLEEKGRLLRFLLARPQFKSLLLPGSFWASGWRVDPGAWARLRAGILEETGPVGLAGRSLALAYGPGQEEEAQALAEALRRMGLRVSLHPLPTAPLRTEVLENGPGTLAEALGRALGLPYRVSGEALLGADLTLRLGGDGWRLKNPSPRP